MNPQELEKIIISTTKAKLPTMVLGAPGIGKTAMYKSAAEKCGYDFKVLYPSLLDPTNIGGLPMPSKGKLERMLDDEMESIFYAKKPTLLLLDEIGQASAAMQAACAPLLLSRKVGKHVLPEYVAVHAATNRRSDRAGASGILTHLISRCAWVGELEVDSDQWLEWALKADVSPEILSFIKFRPALLHSFDASKASQETSAYPCPRSWENASKLLHAIGGDTSIEAQALVGCLGEGAAAELMTHIKTARAEINLDAILDKPASFKMPKELSMRYAVVSGLAVRCGEKTCEAVLKIADKMYKKKNGEFAVMLVRESLVRYSKITRTPAWKTFMKSDLCQAVMDL